jgi:sterol 3beta-glucosyltransferase
MADVAMHALRCKVPQVIAPYTIEQAYWGAKCHALGLSPAPVAPGDTTELTRALEKAIADASIGERLSALSATLQDGTQAAAEAIEAAARQ